MVDKEWDASMVSEESIEYLKKFQEEATRTPRPTPDQELVQGTKDAAQKLNDFLQTLQEQEIEFDMRIIEFAYPLAEKLGVPNRVIIDNFRKVVKL
jgi:hypothetical protein